MASDVTQGRRDEGSDVASSAKRAPSKRWYWAGGAMALASVLVAVAIVAVGFVRMSEQVDDLQRVAVPGERQVTFPEPGGYTVYYEAAAVSDGAEIPSLTVALTPSSGGEAVPFADYGGSFTYSMPGHEGVALWTFRIDEPGTYRLNAHDEGAARGEVAVGRSVAGSLPLSLLAAGAVGTIGVGGGVAVIVATAVRRGRARSSSGPAERI